MLYDLAIKACALNFTSTLDKLLNQSFCIDELLLVVVTVSNSTKSAVSNFHRITR